MIWVGHYNVRTNSFQILAFFNQCSQTQIIGTPIWKPSPSLNYYSRTLRWHPNGSVVAKGFANFAVRPWSDPDLIPSKATQCIDFGGGRVTTAQLSNGISSWIHWCSHSLASGFWKVWFFEPTAEATLCMWRGLIDVWLSLIGSSSSMPLLCRTLWASFCLPGWMAIPFESKKNECKARVEINIMNFSSEIWDFTLLIFFLSFL